MAITVGNISSSGNPGTVNTSYSWNHTCGSGSNCLFVLERAREGTDADRPISGVTYDGNPLSVAHIENDDTNHESAEIWFLINPTTESSLAIEVTHVGKVTDGSSGAVDFAGVDVSDSGSNVVADTSAGTRDGGVTTFSGLSGDALMACIVWVEGSLGDLIIPQGVEIDQVDMGSYCGQAAYNIVGSVVQFENIGGSPGRESAGIGINAAAEEPSTISANINDTISITESVSYLFDLLRIAINDTISAAESTTQSGQLALSINDTITLTEDVARSLTTTGLSVSINDTITVVEALSFLGHLSVSISDSSVITEYIAGVLDKLYVNINDTVSTTELVQSLGQLSTSVYDSIEAVESYTPQGNSLADIYDSITIAEVLERLGYLSRDINDSISISEALEFLGSLSTDINDSVSIVENIAAVIGAIGGLSRNINDTITVAEFLKSQGYMASDINDSVTVAEFIGFLGHLVAIAVDSVTITEDVETLTTTAREILDTITVAEALTFLGQLAQSINDNVTITEALVTLGLINTSISDSISVAESVSMQEATPGLDIGADAIDRPTTLSATATYVDLNNPADDTGTITAIDIWAAANISDLKVGIFYSTGGDDYKVRSVENIGSVTSGSKQTFTGLNLPVVTGDFIGCYFSAGQIERHNNSFDGLYWKLGDHVTVDSDETYSLLTDNAMSLFGYVGAPPEPGYIKDSVSITEYLQTLGYSQVSINDNVSVIESLSVSLVTPGLSVNINDSITISEVLSFLGLLIADVNDSITVSESLNFLGYLSAVVSENITITENVARVTTASRAVYDTVSIAEVLIFLGQLTQSINDNVTVTEALATLGLLSTNVNDTIIIVEDLGRNIYGANDNQAYISDNVSVTEFLQFTGHLQVSISDAITIIESISFGAVDGFFRRPWCRRLSGPFGRGDLFVS